MIGEDTAASLRALADILDEGNIKVDLSAHTLRMIAGEIESYRLRLDYLVDKLAVIEERNDNGTTNTR